MGAPTPLSFRRQAHLSTERVPRACAAQEYAYIPISKTNSRTIIVGRFHMQTAAVPQYHELMWPTLRALRTLGGSGSNTEILHKVIEEEGFSDDAVNELHNDGRQTRLAYNLAWARTYLKKAGYVDNASAGVWRLTDDGSKASETDVIAANRRVIREMSAARKSSSRAQGSEDPQGGLFPPPEPPAQPDWREKLLRTLRSMSPDAFERLSTLLLREAGFVKVEVTGKTGDGGIDGTGVLRVNLLSFQVIFQCKRYQDKVGASCIRDFRGAMVGRCDKGLFITTGTFTPAAQAEATRDGAPALDLVDGPQLCELLRQYGLGVKKKMIEVTEIDESWFSTV